MPLGRRGNLIDLSVVKGKRVLITGNTGFKGSWLTVLLDSLGAKIYGYSLEPPTDPSLYDIAQLDKIVNTKIGDIRYFDQIFDFYNRVSPDYVIHMAAQPLVREGYKNPQYTYEVNVLGTVNIMECVRRQSAKSFLNVTTDKVYRNIETSKNYVETDILDGFDPYSNSKSCSELVTATYRRSYKETRCAISTARAGNVIGGGDFAKDRIIPDCVRAGLEKQDIVIRNPNSVRPYQHVLEPLFAYVAILVSQEKDVRLSGFYNVGPHREDCITTGNLADMFCQIWGDGLSWKHVSDDGPHEANMLMLDNSLIKETIGFVPRWSVREAVEKTIDFTKIWKDRSDVYQCMKEQIGEYIENSIFKK